MERLSQINGRRIAQFVSSNSFTKALLNTVRVAHMSLDCAEVGLNTERKMGLISQYQRNIKINQVKDLSVRTDIDTLLKLATRTRVSTEGCWSISIS